MVKGNVYGVLRGRLTRTFMLLILSSVPNLLYGGQTNLTVVGYQIGEQGANHRVWQKIVRSTDAQGNTLLMTNRAFVEMATGLNYQPSPTNGQWQPSREEIDAYPGGAIAQFGQHKAIFANNLNTPVNASGAVDLQMSNGQELHSSILSLGYYDTASGQSVLIAGVQDSQGQIVNGNEVIYTNAFSGNGVNGNVRYRYTKAGLEQDIILLSQPPPPETFGLSSASSVLQVLTEFDTNAMPSITTPFASTNDLLPDEAVNFGAMRMIPGRAFLLGTNSAATRVSKQWTTVNGRIVLVESVRLSAITNALTRLPKLSEARPKPVSGSEVYMASRTRLLPAAKGGKFNQTTHSPMKLAKRSGPDKGFVMDYIIVNSGTGPTVFSNGVTYFISGPVYCGNVTLGAAIIKYPDNTTAFIEVYSGSTFNCQTGPYKPCIFTAGDDDSVGEAVGDAWAGHGGVIQPGGYANPALRFDGHVALHDVRICYAQEAISAWSGANASLTNVQIFNCEVGVDLWTGGNGDYTGNGGPGAVLNNCLIASPDPNHAGSDALSGGGSYANFGLWNCTIDNFAGLMGIGDDNSGPGNIDGESSVFTDLGNFGSGGVGGNDDVFWNTPSTFGNGSEYDDYGNPYIQVGGGGYYLNPGVPSNTFGFPSLPVDYSNLTINQITTLGPQPYNTGPGYNYPRLDYIFSQTQVSANLTFQPRTIAAWQGAGLSFSGGLYTDFQRHGGKPVLFRAVQRRSGAGGQWHRDHRRQWH